MTRTGLAFALFVTLVLCARPASGGDPEPLPKPGWVDENHDGINDRFHDANGDGIDDVTGRPYPHDFKFEDKDKDGKNDLFIDADGDGVNDLAGSRPGLVLVLDHDHTGKNDITGAKYSPRRLYGDCYGKVKEDTALRRTYVDRDMDGINDVFVDRDGDGICDGRTLPRPVGMGMGPNNGNGASCGTGDGHDPHR